MTHTHQIHIDWPKLDCKLAILAQDLVQVQTTHCSHVCRGWYFLLIFQLSRSRMPRVRAWRMTTSCSTRHGFLCCKVADHRQKSGIGQTTSSVSVSLGMFNAPSRNYRFRMCSAPGELPKRPRRWLQRKFVVSKPPSQHWGDDDGEELATLQSCLHRARSHPSPSRGPRRGRSSERSIAKSSGIQASVRRRSGSGGETPRGSATRSGKVGCWAINGESVRRSSYEAVSAGRFRAPLRRGNAGMDAGASCRSPGGRCGRTSPGSGEGFSAHHHCCSGVAGVDQPTIGHNAIICRKMSWDQRCRDAVQFHEIAQEVGIERSQGRRSITSRAQFSPQTDQVVEKGGSILEMPARTD